MIRSEQPWLQPGRALLDTCAVGWAERSEAQRCAARMLGFAALSPTYAESMW